MGWPFGRRTLAPRTWPASAGTWRAAPGGLVKITAPGVIPVEAFRRRVQVPIGIDGQVQGTMPGFLALSGGPVTSPGAFANILFATVPAGTYLVAWTVTLAGTLGAGDANNFALYANGSLVASSVNAGAAGSYPQTAQLVTLAPGAGNLKILTSGAGTAGSQYSASIPQNLGQPGTLALQAGPAGVGASWALDQAGLATSIGQSDPATCAVYVGPQPIAPYLVAQSYVGGGDAVGLAGYTLQPGEFVFAVWSAGTPASTAQLKVAGTKSVLAA